MHLWLGLVGGAMSKATGLLVASLPVTGFNKRWGRKNAGRKCKRKSNSPQRVEKSKLFVDDKGLKYQP